MSQAGAYTPAGGGGGGGVLTLVADNTVAVTPNGLGEILVLGTGGIVTTGNNGTHTLTISGTPSGTTWINATVNQAMIANTNYMVTANAVTLSLPGVANFGDEIEVVLDGGASFSIDITGQTVLFGDVTATSAISSNFQGDAIRLVCKQSGLLWAALSSMGNLNYS